MRSHPPTLLTLLRRTLREECRVRPGEHWLIAVSGGSDSQALMHALARVAPEFDLRLSAHGVDHGLRPEATAELALARQLAERVNLPFATTRVTVEPGGNLQARARAARYSALWQVAKSIGAECLATGHHADDRAETVLMRLLRGAGPRGLAVLSPRQGNLVRPLVRVRKAEILRHLTRHGIDRAGDPSNLDRRFLRVRVRLDVLPLLLQLSPAIVEHLNALSDQILAPEPRVTDSTGRELVLGRAQAEQLRRAETLGLRNAAVRLPGGRELRIHARSGRVTVLDADRLR